MKQCPRCTGLELYDDSEQYCPYCHTVLVKYERSNRRRDTVGESSTTEQVHPRQQRRETAIDAPTFETREGNVHIYRGRVMSISPTSRFMSGFEKWANAVFLGRPYQIGNPVYETNIRIEEINWNRIPEQAQNLIYFGEPGEINVGDDVTATAVQRRGRFEVRSLRINDVNGTVKMDGLISSAVFRVISIIIILLIVALIAGLVSFFSTGKIWTMLGGVAGAAASIIYKIILTLAPIILLSFVIWLLIKGRH